MEVLTLVDPLLEVPEFKGLEVLIELHEEDKYDEVGVEKPEEEIIEEEEVKESQSLP